MRWLHQKVGHFSWLVLILVLQLSCHYNTDFVKKMNILEEKNVKVHRHMHSANPQALLTRFVSMGNENQTTVWLASGKH